jgi:glycosyltransferase involved in cell wall biosynthesis
MGSATFHIVEHQKNPKDVARYYQATHLYIHAARADTFPRTALKPLACDLPVIATEAGGIPKQIKGWRGLNVYCPDSNHYPAKKRLTS